MSSFTGGDSSSDRKRPPAGTSGSASTSQPNGTIGRIIAVPGNLGPLSSYHIKSTDELREELKEKRQRYADYKSGKLKLSGQEAVELREDIHRLSDYFDPGGQQLWPAPDASEQAFIDRRAAYQQEQMRRAANDLGIAAAGPVLGFLPMLGRIFGAPEAVVEGLGEVNFNVGLAAWGHGKTRQSQTLGIPNRVAESKTGGKAPKGSRAAREKESQSSRREENKSKKGKGNTSKENTLTSKDGVVIAAKPKYRRSMSERRKALLRDANNPNSKLDPEARQYILDNNGNRVPEGYEVSHNVPLETEATWQGKASLDLARNMRTLEKPVHRALHQECGALYHLVRYLRAHPLE